MILLYKSLLPEPLIGTLFNKSPLYLCTGCIYQIYETSKPIKKVLAYSDMKK